MAIALTKFCQHPMTDSNREMMENGKETKGESGVGTEKESIENY